MAIACVPYFFLRFGIVENKISTAYNAIRVGGVLAQAVKTLKCTSKTGICMYVDSPSAFALKTRQRRAGGVPPERRRTPLIFYFQRSRTAPYGYRSAARRLCSAALLCGRELRPRAVAGRGGVAYSRLARGSTAVRISGAVPRRRLQSFAREHPGCDPRVRVLPGVSRSSRNGCGPCAAWRLRLGFNP